MNRTLMIALACVAAVGGCATWPTTAPDSTPATGVSASPAAASPAPANVFEPEPQHWFGSEGP